MKKPLLLFISMYLVLSPGLAFSQEQDDWQFDLAPFYLWAINIDGDIGIRGRVAQSSIDFSDVWSNLQGVFTTRFSVIYRQKFGLLVDYNYLDLGTEPVTRVGATEIGFTSQVLNVAGTYRFLEGRHTLDGVAGIRYNNLDSEIVLKLINVTLDGDKDWVDPIVGLRYNYDFTERWSLRLYGDIGGFGVASDFTWQTAGWITYHPWESVAFIAGFRAIGTDYTSGSSGEEFTYDTTGYGPLVGVDIRW